MRVQRAHRCVQVTAQLLSPLAIFIVPRRSRVASWKQNHRGALTCWSDDEGAHEDKNIGCRSDIYNSINNLQAHYRWYVTHCR